MKKYFGGLALLLALFYGWGCSDVLVVDISEDSVVVITPLDSAQSSQAVQNFWWEELDGADSYLLTVVSPSFDDIQRRVIEASITGTTSYDTTLTSGAYQWAIQGVNEGYESKNDIYTLFISNDSTSNLANKIVFLTSPAADAATRDSQITFRWDEVDNADSYTLQIASPNFSDLNNIQLNELIENNSLTATLSEGSYRWRVRAENSTSVTPFAERGLSIDQTAPSAPVLISPGDGATVILPSNLSWTPDNSSSKDEVFVYSDSTQNNIVFQTETTETNISFNDSSFSTYYWHVRSVDPAGNVSAFSSLRSFLAQ